MDLGAFFTQLDARQVLHDDFQPVKKMPHKRVQIRSVPHTGTCFTKKLFQDTRGEFEAECSHSWATFAADLREFAPVICPIRRPEDVLKTWNARDTFRDFDWFECWSGFNKAFCSSTADQLIVLPVDVPEIREQSLSRIRKVFDYNFCTDWQPVKSRPELHTDDPLSQELLRPVYDLEVVQAFYSYSNY